MSLRRFDAKRDANEPAIVDALEDIGVTCYRISEPGLPDLLVWTQREGFRLIEVKMPGKKLNIRQQATRRYVPFAVVESVADALALFGVTA